MCSDGLETRADGKVIVLERLTDDLYIVPDAGFDEFPLRLERPAEGAPEVWHGDRRYIRSGELPRALPKPSLELRAIAGHYRSHNPWTTNFRVVLRGDRAWLVFPSAQDAEVEQPLVPSTDGSFRVGDDPRSPERLRFDAVAEGRALRACLSGWPYYRIA